MNSIIYDFFLSYGMLVDKDFLGEGLFCTIDKTSIICAY